MTGQFKGVATRFKNKYPRLKTFHCMAHRLELAVKNAVDDVNPVSHVRTFIDCIYKVQTLQHVSKEPTRIADYSVRSRCTTAEGQKDF